MTKQSNIIIGDRVGYAAAWLRSTGNYTGALPFARGTVTKLEKFGGPGWALATVKWENDHFDEVPTTILDCNLAKVGSAAMSAN